MLKFKSPYDGKTYEALIYANRYADNNRLYFALYTFTRDEDVDDDDCGYWEPYCDITVNLYAFISNTDCSYLDTNNAPFIVKFLLDNKLGKLTGRTAQSGFCEYPEFEFDLEEMKYYLSEDSII